MKKTTKDQREITEEDIEKTIQYLRIHNPLHSTREDAIHFLQGMQGAAHILAHKIVERKNTKNSN